MQLRFSSLGEICRGVHYTVSLNFDQLAVYNLLQINLMFCKVALQLQSSVLSMKLNYLVKIRRMLYFCWCHLLINTAPGLTVADCACAFHWPQLLSKKNRPLSWEPSRHRVEFVLEHFQLGCACFQPPCRQREPHLCRWGAWGGCLWSHSIAWW